MDISEDYGRYLRRLTVYTLLLVIIITSSVWLHAFPHASALPSYAPGVKPGDSVTYGEFSVNNTTPYPPFSGNISSLKIQVDSVTNQTNTVSASLIYFYQNGTQTTQSLVGSTDTGQGNIFPYIMGGGLRAGDPIFKNSLGYYPYTLNETVNRVYAGALRTVNLLNLTIQSPSYSVRASFYWDAQTGLLLEAYEAANYTYSTGPSYLQLYFEATQTNVWTAETNADFTLDAASQTSEITHAGEIASFRLDTARINNFNGTINLASLLVGSIPANPPTVTLAPTSLTLSSTDLTATSILSFSSNSSTTLGNYLISVNATDGSISHQVLLAVTLAPPDYIITANPGNLTILQGASKNSTIIVTGRGGFTGTVLLTVQPQFYGPSVSAILSIYQVSLNSTVSRATAVLSVTASLSSLPGTTTVGVNAAGGNIFRSLYILVNVTGPDFRISASPASLTLSEGQSAKSTITLTSILGFKGIVNLTASAYSPVSAILDSNSLNLTADGQISTTLTVSAPTAGPPGFYFVNVVGTSSNNLYHSIYLNLNLTGPDFRFTASQNFLTLQAGQSANTTLTLSAVQGFSGTVSFSANAYGGLAPSVSPTFIVLNSTHPTATAILTTTILVGQPPSYSSEEITATSGNIVKTIYIPVQIIGPDFSISTNPNVLSIPQGGSENSTIQLTSLDNFSGAITLSAQSNLPTKLTPSNVNLASGGNANATLTVQVPMNITPGNYYYVNIVASSGPIVRYGFVNIIVTGPDFSILANPSFLTVSQGQVVNSTITLTSIDNFKGPVTVSAFTYSPRISIVPNSTILILASNSSTTTSLQLSIPANTPPGFYYVQVSAFGGGLNRYTTIAVDVIGPDFSIFANPNFLIVRQGSTATSSITLTSILGFSGNVSLSTTSQNFGLFASLANSTIHLASGGTAQTTLTIQASSSLNPGGYYSIGVNATSGFLRHIIFINIQVTAPDFSLQSNPSFLTVKAGQSASSSIIITAINGFNGTVTLSAFAFLPGISVALSKSNVTLNQSSAIVTLNINTTIATAGQTVFVDVQGTSKNVTHFTSVQVTITGSTFSLAANPSFLTINAGSSAASLITVTSLGGFSGQVSLSTVPPFQQIQASLSPQNVTLSSGGIASSTLNVTALSSTTNGFYFVTVTGTNGSLVRSITIEVQVTGPFFSISAVPDFLTVVPDVSAQSTITLNGFNGFNGQVQLFAFAPGFTDSLSPETVTLNATATTASATLTLTALPNATAGLHYVTVEATSGSINQTTTLFVVVASPDFSILGQPQVLTLQRGGSVSSTISLTSINSFNGTVTLSASTDLGTSFPNSTIHLSPGGIAFSNLTITAPINAYTGFHLVTVTGTAGQLTHSIVLQVMVNGPDYSITASPSHLTLGLDTNMTSTISLTSLSAFSGTIQLSIVSRDLPQVQIGPSEVSLAAGGTASATLTVSLLPYTYPANYFITVIANASGLVHYTVIEVTAVTPNFLLSAQPSSATVGAGSPAISTVTVTTYNGFTGAVHLRANVYVISTSIQTDALSVSFSSANVTFTGSNSTTSVVTISVTGYTPAGNYRVVITGEGFIPGIVLGRGADITVAVPVGTSAPDFQASANPAFPGIPQGQTGVSSISLTSLNQFAGNVSLTANIWPPGPTLSIPSSVAVNVGGTTMAKLTISTGSAVAGTYYITVNATGGGFSHYVTVTVFVTSQPDFKMSPPQSSLTIQAGHSASTSITLTGLNGFSDTIRLSTVGTPLGALASPNPSAISLSSGQTLNATLQISTTANTPPGVYTVIVIGNSTFTSHSTTLVLTVTAPADFALATSTSGLIIASGTSATSTITVSPLLGFTSPVTLSATVPSGFTSSFNPDPVLGGTGASTLTLSVASTIIPGNYTITVKGTGGSFTHSVSFLVTVSASQSITLTVTQVSWTHRLSLSKTNGLQTWTMVVKNTGKSATYVQILAAGNATSLTSSFTLRTSITLLSPGTSVKVTLTQPFGSASRGLKYNFAITLYYGTAIDVSGNLMSPQVIPVAKGFFTVVK